jgi:hypothetical protein
MSTGDVFLVTPNPVITVEPNQMINFTCRLTAELEGRGNFPGWEYMVINDTQFRTVNPAEPESIEKYVRHDLTHAALVEE